MKAFNFFYFNSLVQRCISPNLTRFWKFLKTPTLWEWLCCILSHSRLANSVSADKYLITSSLFQNRFLQSKFIPISPWLLGWTVRSPPWTVSTTVELPTYAVYRLLFIKRLWIIKCGEHFSSIKPNHTTDFFAGPSFKCICRHINYSRLNIMTDPYATCCRFPVLQVLLPSNK